MMEPRPIVARDLPYCTLCPQHADPRMGFMTREGKYYPLCDGCSPSGTAGCQQLREIADRCRASERGPTDPLSRFGFNEPS